MIGAMPAVAVRHERRKQGGKTTASSLLGLQKGGGAGGGGSRPNALLLKPHLSKGAGGGVGAGDGHTPGVGSRRVSRAGSPSPLDGDATDPTHMTTHFRYGDECFYGKVSLLHFVVFFLLGGVTVIVVGAVQFKEEAGWSELRYEFLVAGCLLMGVGLLLLLVKCAFYRTPIPVGTLVMVDSPGGEDEEKKEKSDEGGGGDKDTANGKKTKKDVSIVPALSSAATAEEKRRRRHSSHHTTVLSVTTPGGGVGFPSADADAAAAALAAAARSQRRGSACVVATSPRAEAKFSNPV